MREKARNQLLQKLDTEFYQRSTTVVARELLGKTLLRRIGHSVLAGTIVEVEAYLSQRDAASHSARGCTPSNRSMFAKPGTLYVYPIHSRHCLNVVTEPPERGAAVLVRAVEPLFGLTTMARYRGLRKELGAEQPWQLTRGPGRLCEALGVDRHLDGVDLAASQEIWLAQPPLELATRPWRRRSSVRIGISRARARRLRWFIDGNRCVSGAVSDHSSGRSWLFQDEILRGR